jgi:small neutral amino acid transporter SnatA (MarC family)
MTGWLALFVLLLAAANPATGARTNRTGETRALAAGIAAAMVAIGLVSAAAGAESLLDAFEIEQETARIAAGLVLAMTGGQAIVLGGPLVRDIPRDWQRGIYPLGIPLAVNPALVACAVAFAAHPDAGAARAATLATSAGLATAAVALLLPPRLNAFADALARLTGGLAVLLAAAMVVSGVRDV